MPMVRLQCSTWKRKNNSRRRNKLECSSWSGNRHYLSVYWYIQSHCWEQFNKLKLAYRLFLSFYLRLEVLDHNCQRFKLLVTAWQEFFELQDDSTLVLTFCFVLCQLSCFCASWMHICGGLGLYAWAFRTPLLALINWNNKNNSN